MGAGSEHTLQLPSVVAAERGVTLNVMPPSYEEMSDDENSGGEYAYYMCYILEIIEASLLFLWVVRCYWTLSASL